jgi:hypothetical protein
MFIKFESKYIDGISYSDEDDPLYIAPYHYVITDSDFTDDWEGYSIWHAIFHVYSKKELNVYGNLAIALKKYCIENKFSIYEDMIRMLATDKHYSDLNINIDEVEKYLMLV